MTRSGPTFSVVITTFNRKNLLKRCLESLETQSFRDFEVIVADDGSTDGSDDLAILFKDRLPISYSWANNWGGPAVPRNRGASLATGRWIAFLDSDDYFLPNKLDFIFNHIKAASKEVAVIYHPLAIVRAGIFNGTLKVRDFSHNAWSRLASLGNGIALSGAVVRSESFRDIGGFLQRKEFVGSEDFDLWLRMAKMGHQFMRVNKVLGVYDSDGTDKLSGANTKILSCCKNVIYFHSPWMSNLERRQSLGYLAYFGGMLALSRRDLRGATSELLKALLLSHYILKVKSIFRLIQIQFCRMFRSP